jgi:hypothetical protein
MSRIGTAVRGFSVVLAVGLQLACSHDSGAPTGLFSLHVDGISGFHQHLMEGEISNAPYVVRVVDAFGNGVDGVQVAWSGPGVFWDGTGEVPRRVASGTVQVVTSGGGYSEIRFQPNQRGPITIYASLLGSGLPVKFQEEVSLSTIVRIGWLLDCIDPMFSGADTVFLGATVTWMLDPAANQYCPGAVAQVTSTSEPASGLHFESPTLHVSERFTFTPNVVGTWHYADPFYGGSGTLVVRDGL